MLFGDFLLFEGVFKTLYKSIGLQLLFQTCFATVFAFKHLLAWLDYNRRKKMII